MSTLMIAVIALVSLILIAIAAYALAEYKKGIEENHMDEIDFIYSRIWTGHEYDRVHAWYRVMAHLEVTDRWELMPEANRRLRILKEQRISDSYVTVNGKPVLHRELL